MYQNFRQAKMSGAEAEENNISCSIVWRYFEKTLHNNVIICICEIKSKMPFKCASGSSGLLRNHLLLCHCAQHDEMLIEENKKK